MKEISEQLKEIANTLNSEYIRAASLSDSNIQVHYKSLSRPLIVYAGFGDSSNYYEGAEPLKSVSAEIYILDLAPETDSTAEQLDDIMSNLNQIGSDIVYRFETVRDTLTYSMDGVSMFDDLLVGYLLSVDFIIAGNVCTDG